METFDFVVLFRILLRKWWILVLIPLVAVIITFFLTNGIPDLYKSTGQLSTGFTTNDQISITNEGSSIREAGVKFNNMIETMKSELILSLVSYRLLIHDLNTPSPFRKEHNNARVLSAEEARGVVEICSAKLERMELLSSFDPKEREVLDVLAAYGYSNWQLLPELTITRVKDTDYLKIQFKSTDPLLSAYVVNTLSEEYIRYDNDLKSSRSGQSVTFFENLVRDTKKVLDEKTQLLNAYRANNNIVNYSVETATGISQISIYEQNRTETLNKIQALRLSIANANKQLNSLGGDQSSSNSNSKILELQNKIAELTKIYKDGGSTDSNLQKSITALRYDLQVEMDRIATLENVAGQSKAGVRAELEAKKNQFQLELQIAESNLGSINATLATLNNSVSGIANKEVTIQVLTGEVENATKEYNEALARFNTERNKSLIAGSPIRMVVEAQPNGYPEKSKRWILVGFSGVASFIVSLLSIVAVELIDMRLKNAVQFRKFVPLELAGTINLINSEKLDLEQLFSDKIKSKELEVFKHFLRKLRFEVESTKAQTFLVTSTKRNEGKTFVLLCLAYSLSLIRKKILIIDTNFRHNSLTSMLLGQNKDYKKLESGVFIKGLIGNADPEEMSEEDFVHSIISPTSHKGINIIGNPGGDSSPSEIFAGRNFNTMMNELASHYDYVFLEGSSLNDYSDTKELVEYVQKVIPIFSSESVIKQLDRESIGYLKNLNGKLMGAVLNKVEMKALKV